MLERLQIPIEQSKLESLTICLTFLGIEIDSECLQQCMTHKKLVDLKAKLAVNFEWPSIQKKEVEKLTGLISVCLQNSKARETIPSMIVCLKECNQPPKPCGEAKQASYG